MPTALDLFYKGNYICRKQHITCHTYKGKTYIVFPDEDVKELLFADGLFEEKNHGLDQFNSKCS